MQNVSRLLAGCMGLFLVGCGGSDEGEEERKPTGYQAVSACEAEQPCGSSMAQLVESSGRNFVQLESARCVLEALKERRPGLYSHDARNDHGSGADGVEHVFNVLPDGKLYYARVDFVDNQMPDAKPEDSYRRESQSQRCELADASYFDACIHAIDELGEVDGMGSIAPSSAEDIVWRCIYQEPRAAELPWLSGCENAEIACESGE